MCARIICATLENGVSQAEIEEALQERINPPQDQRGNVIRIPCRWVPCEDDDRKRDRLQQAQAIAVQIASNNETLYAIATGTLGFLALQLAALASTVGAIPLIGRPLAAGVRLVSLRVTRLEGQFVSTRAANDALFRQVANL